MLAVVLGEPLYPLTLDRGRTVFDATAGIKEMEGLEGHTMIWYANPVTLLFPVDS